MLRILIVGHGEYGVYDKAFYHAAKKMSGVIVTHVGSENEYKKCCCRLLRRVEKKISLGWYTNLINHKILRICENNQFDIVFLYNCIFLYKNTVKRIREGGAYVACYSNDNPFSTYYPAFYWRHFIRAIPECDMVYVYREENIDDAKRNGANRVKQLMSYYIACSCSLFLQTII